jgi:hypothetical protein
LFAKIELTTVARSSALVTAGVGVTAGAGVVAISSYTGRLAALLASLDGVDLALGKLCDSVNYILVAIG